MCLYPKLIRNKKYTSNKKNAGVIPLLKDERTLYVPIGCQNCYECRKKKSREWQCRLLEDIKHHKNARFITLTFCDKAIQTLHTEVEQEKEKLRNNTDPFTKEITQKRLKKLESYGHDNAIATLGMRRFLERWRKEYGKSLRHWMVTEMGHNGTNNIHLHGIIWTSEDLKIVENIWQYGWVWKGKDICGRIINYVNNRTISYVTKYVTKVDEKHSEFKSKILTSAGIGNGYTKQHNSRLNKFDEEKTIEYYRTDSGHKIWLPIYWRNKLYTEEQREKLWLHKLDKQTRYIMGEKIDVSQGDKIYLETLKYYQKINKELGYKNDKKNWKKIEYEENIRAVNLKTRLERAA